MGGLRFQFYTISATLLLLLSACGPVPRQRVAATLADVESYINDRPDSALAVLEQLDSSCLHSARQRAKYCLLLAIAHDKTYQDEGALVSEMESTASYYAVSGNPARQMLAYYYLADQQNDAGNQIEAAVNFTRAFDLAEEQGNYFFSGMAARNLSDIYCSVYNYAQALNYAQRSVDSFTMAEKPDHILYAKLLLANGYYNYGQFDECIALCDSLIFAARQVGNNGLLVDALSSSAGAYIQKEIPDSTISRLNEAQKYYPLSVKQQAIYAWALCLNKQYKQAETFLKEAYLSAFNKKDSLQVFPWEARIADAVGDSRRSARLLKEMLDDTNEQIHLSIPQAIEHAQAQYYKRQQTSLIQKIRQNREIALAFFSVAVLIILSLLLLLRIRKMQAEQRSREQRIRLEEKDRAYQELSRKLALYGSTVEETLDFGFSVLNQLSDAYYHPNTAQERTFRDIIGRYVSDISSRKQLGESIEQNINIIHDDVISKLRKEIPSLKEKDIKLFSLYLFGFSYKAINAFFPGASSLNTSYSQVFRLKRKIEKSGSSETAFFLSFLENRPSYGQKDVQKT